MSKLPVHNRSPFPRRTWPRALTIAAALAPAALLLSPGSAIAQLLEMPSVTPEQADLYFATRVVPPSDAPPLSTVMEPIQPLPVAPVVGHDLPTDATTPSGMPRADFAIAKSATNVTNIVLGTETLGVMGGGESSAGGVLTGQTYTLQGGSDASAGVAIYDVEGSIAASTDASAAGSSSTAYLVSSGGANQWATASTSTLSGASPPMTSVWSPPAAAAPATRPPPEC
jgi:hypothetical protein